MKKSGFTLVEMLIVVVIIGILASALLPRLTGYMARTRDMKRVADLRNIAAAIEMYRNDYGEFPFPHDQNGNRMSFSDPRLGYIFSATELSYPLFEYLSKIPTDPNKKNFVDIHVLDQWIVSQRLKPGEYLYQFGKKGNTNYGVVGLVAKVETPEKANYVLKDRKNYMRGDGCGWEVYRGPIQNNTTIESINNLNLCTSITKSEVGQEKVATVSNKDCAYSSVDQLYYIVKVE